MYDLNSPKAHYARDWQAYRIERRAYRPLACWDWHGHYPVTLYQEPLPRGRGYRFAHFTEKTPVNRALYRAGQRRERAALAHDWDTVREAESLIERLATDPEVCALPIVVAGQNSIRAARGLELLNL